MEYLNIRLHAQKNVWRQDYTPNKLVLLDGEHYQLCVNIPLFYPLPPPKKSKQQQASQLFRLLQGYARRQGRNKQNQCMHYFCFQEEKKTCPNLGGGGELVLFRIKFRRNTCSILSSSASLNTQKTLSSPPPFSWFFNIFHSFPCTEGWFKKGGGNRGC